MAKKAITIGEQIENELEIVNTTVIPINPTYAPTYNELIELISLYLNSKYRGKDTDEEGFKRWFLNINDYRCKTASKSLDIDTKDIMLIAEPGQSYMPVWFLSRELKTYMKEDQWAKLFNDIIKPVNCFYSITIGILWLIIGFISVWTIYGFIRWCIINLATWIIAGFKASQ